MTQTKSATIDDLARVADHGKAELIAGVIVPMSPTGFLPNLENQPVCAFWKVLRSLR